MKALIIIGCIALYLVCCAASMCIIIAGKKEDEPRSRLRIKDGSDEEV